LSIFQYTLELERIALGAKRFSTFEMFSTKRKDGVDRVSSVIIISTHGDALFLLPQ
jgi:hypothetical protein